MNASKFVYARSIGYSFEMILYFDTMKIERTSTRDSNIQYILLPRLVNLQGTYILYKHNYAQSQIVPWSLRLLSELSNFVMVYKTSEKSIQVFTRLTSGQKNPSGFLNHSEQ